MLGTYITEIETKKLAKLGDGYIVRTQEFNGIDFHILGIGFEHDSFDNNIDPRKAVELIHKYKGLAQLNHPGVITSPDLYKKVNNSQEESKAKELADMCDTVETFNAQNINLWLASPVAYLLNKFYKKNIDVFMKSSNNFAEKLNTQLNKPGTQSSNAKLSNQIKSNGIYLPDEEISTEFLFYRMKDGLFELSEKNQYHNIHLLQVWLN